MTPLQSSSLMENDTKRTGWHMSKNSFPHHYIKAGQISQWGHAFMSANVVSHTKEMAKATAAHI